MSLVTPSGEWVPLVGAGEPATSATSAPSAAVARLAEDVSAFRAVVVPEIGEPLGTYVTRAWAWCPDGPELPRAVVLDWGLRLPPLPGLGKLVDLMLSDLTGEVPPPADFWGEAPPRGDDLLWGTDVEHPEPKGTAVSGAAAVAGGSAESAQAVTDLPSALVFGVWRAGFPVSVGGTVTVLAPGYDPRDRLPLLLARAEAQRADPGPLAPAGAVVVRLVRALVSEARGGRDPGTAGAGTAGAGTAGAGTAGAGTAGAGTAGAKMAGADGRHPDATAGPGLAGGLKSDSIPMPVDPVHPRAAGVFRLPPVVPVGRPWWPPRPDPTAGLPTPPPTPPPVLATASATGLPAEPAGADPAPSGTPSAVQEWPDGRASTGWGRRPGAAESRSARKRRARSNAGQRRRRGRGGPPGGATTPVQTPGAAPQAAAARPPRHVLPTLVAATATSLVVALVVQRLTVSGTIESDAGWVVALWGIGLVGGPMLLLGALGCLLRKKPMVRLGRTLLWAGTVGVELFLALSLIAVQAGETLF